MDPLTHTLLGAALADSGLARAFVARPLPGRSENRQDGPTGATTPGATEPRGHRLDTPVVAATLIIGANLPDIDFLTYFLGQDLALYWRRGWTHGLLAMFVLPFLLACGMYLWARRRARPADLSTGRPSKVQPLSFRALLALAAVGVWSHPTLDWLNTYGVRLLMPFDDRWFYGDVLFIIEPWLWLILGGAVFLRHSRSLRGLLGWGVLAVLTSLAVLGGAPGTLARAVWIAGLLLLAMLRFRQPAALAPPSPWPARLALIGFGVYVALLMGGDRLVEHRARVGWPAEAKGEIEALMVGPLPADPLRRDIVVVTADKYHFFTWDWRRDERLAPAVPASLPRLGSTPTIEAALAAPCLRGMAQWMRFPFAELEENDGGTTVHLLDARYTRRRTQGFGGESVWIDHALEPRCDEP